MGLRGTALILTLCAVASAIVDVSAVSLTRALVWQSIPVLALPAALLGAGLVALLLSGRFSDPASNRPVRFAVGAVWLVVGVATTAGPSIAESAWRWPLVAAAVLLPVAGLWGLAQVGRRVATILCLVGIVALLAVDLFVLPRLYPAFHFGVVLYAFCLAAELAFRLSGGGRRSTRYRIGLGGFGSLLTALGAFAALYLSIPEMPISGKVLVSSGRQDPVRIEPRRKPVTTVGSSWDLAGRDVVILSIDAVRAGSVDKVTMPRLSARATQGVRFTQAYTPTPNSSYALASMHSGTWVHAAALVGAPLPEATLASEFRAHGYRTYAVFPPSVFSVDRTAMAQYAVDAFGFEERSHDGDGIETACADLQQRLEADPRPLFFWAHVMDPHQPYTPKHPRFGGRPIERYRAELYELDAKLDACLDWLVEHPRRPVVIVTSDHGEAFGEHRSYYHGSTLYEEQLHIPLFFFGGELKPERHKAIVSLVDLAPTLLASVDRLVPATMLGQDLSNPDRISEERFVAVLNDSFAVRRGSEKGVCHGPSGRCELYDLAVDPQERRPRSLEASWAQTRIVEALGWLADTRQAGERDDFTVSAFGCHDPDGAIRVARDTRAALFRRLRALKGLSDCPTIGEALAIELLGDGYMRVEAAYFLAEHGTERALGPIRKQLAVEKFLAGKQALTDALIALESKE